MPKYVVPKQGIIEVGRRGRSTQYVVPGQVLGVSSGSTTSVFVSLLALIAGHIAAAVAASETTAQALRRVGAHVLDLNDVTHIPVYVDGADEVDPQFALIKGGGASLTR